MNVKWTEKYRPNCLDDIVGQPAVAFLKALAANPMSCNVMLECAAGGVGKTSAALALGKELGITDEMNGLLFQPCSELDVDRCREIFDSSMLRCRPMMGSGWRLIVFEEFDWISPQAQRYLKVALETKLPAKCIVAATTNDSSKLDSALLQRFQKFQFQSGSVFASACRQRLAQIWMLETGQRSLPEQIATWGEGKGGEYSLRDALTQAQMFWMAMSNIRANKTAESEAA